MRGVLLIETPQTMIRSLVETATASSDLETITSHYGDISKVQSVRSFKKGTLCVPFFMHF